MNASHVGTWFADRVLVSRRFLTTVAVTVSLMLAGPATVFAGREHRSCLARHHACGATDIVLSCCCGMRSGMRSDLSTPLLRVTPEPYESGVLAPADVPLIGVPAIVILHGRCPGAGPPASGSDLPIRFGDLRL